MIEKHFVEFYSPGTFVSEQTTLPIDTWDVKEAVAMSKGIKERYGATPYGFRFTTRSRTDTDLDSKETAKSALYHLGGTILTLADVKARSDPQDRILISNMECNGIARVITNCNSWSHTTEFGENDVLLNPETGEVVPVEVAA